MIKVYNYLMTEQADVSKDLEFYAPKAKTIICDVDGTILKHLHAYSDFNKFDPELLSGVQAKFNEWDAAGHKIIIMTARRESSRKMTEDALRSLGIMWDQLIMGVTSGTRVLINDKVNAIDPDRAVAVNVITNNGFNEIDWKRVGL